MRFLPHAPRGAALAAAVLLGAAARPGRAQPAAAPTAPPEEPGDLTGRFLAAAGIGSGRQLVRGPGATGSLARTRLLGTARVTAWVRPTWALDLSASQLGPGEEAAVTPVLLGAAWYPRVGGATLARPYLGASAGLFVRRAGEPNGGLAPRVRTDAVPGARLAAGVDVFAPRRVVVGALAGYHVAGRFDGAAVGEVGTATRAAGPMFAVTVGLLLPPRQAP